MENILIYCSFPVLFNLLLFNFCHIVVHNVMMEVCKIARKGTSDLTVKTSHTLNCSLGRPKLHLHVSAS